MLLEETFFRHVSHAQKCKNAYSKEEWEAMKSQRRRQVEKKSQKKRNEVEG